MTEPSSLVSLLRSRARLQPERVAYVFLQDGEAETARLTYGDLDERARAVAARLQQEAGAEAGERALLLFPPGLEFLEAFFGCLYAGVVAVPSYPPRPGREQPRLRSIVEDSRPRFALSTAGIAAKATVFTEAEPAFAGMCWIVTENIPSGLAGEWTEPEVSGETLAFLQYTSGSTADPKGVEVSHGNLLFMEDVIRRAFAQDEESVVVGWLPVYHDMGLIGNVLQPLHLGSTCVLMSPVAFLRRPRRWLEAISRYRGTTSGGPNFAYELCVERIPEAERAGLDLSSWRVAFNGAEPVRASTLERFAAAFAPYGFRREAFLPCYGLAEATLLVSGTVSPAGPEVVAVEDGEKVRELVSCGPVPEGMRVEVVDPASLEKTAPGQEGELWVEAGPGVPRGYWRRPEVNREVFDARTADGDGPYLRTGDLGFLRGGELYVTGRLKDLIILRGRNHYPQDLELTAERSAPGLATAGGAAFSVEVDGEERLVVVQEVVPRLRPTPEQVEELAGAIRRAVAENHEAQAWDVVVLRPGALPKTSSGKVQRGLCRRMYLDGSLEVLGHSQLVEVALAGGGEELDRVALLALAPEDRPEALESWLRSLAARVLRVPAVELRADRPLIELGLDSLAAIELGHAVEAALGVELPVASVLEGAGVREVAEGLAGQSSLITDGAEAPSPAQRGRVGEGALSQGQRGLWFLHRLAPNGTAYHLAAAARVHGDISTSTLRAAFQTLADRHAALRTTYAAGPDGEPVAHVHPSLPVGFTEHGSETPLEDTVFRPFDLENGPLLRADLFEESNGRVLAVSVHHIAADYWSFGVLVRELGILLAGGDLGPASVLSYPDFVRWQERFLAGEDGERLWRYWHDRLHGLPPLDLPLDRPRSVAQVDASADHGGCRRLVLSGALADRLKSVASTSGTTLFAVLLTTFQAWLHRLTGQADLAVGSPLAGRPAGLPGIGEVVGYFINPVVLRSELPGDPSFGELLAQSRSRLLQALQHGDFPLPTLVQRLRPEHEDGHLVQAMLLVHRGQPDAPGLPAFALGEPGGRLSLGSVELESLALDPRAAQFDLTLNVGEHPAGLALSLVYDAALLDGTTAARWLGHLATLAEGAATDPAARISDLPLLSAAERQQLAVEYNDREVPAEPVFPRVFEERARRHPERTALSSEGLSATYAELNARANSLARHLRKLGVEPEAPIGVYLDRGPDLVASLLAVMKAGGAYVPLDPSYPAERLTSMLEDAGARLVVTRRDRFDLPLPGLHPVFVETVREDPGDLPLRIDPDRLAYVLYTSGSTGKPKGVQISHGALANLLRAMAERPGLGPSDRLLAVTPVSFDISGLELYLPLAVGAELVLVSRETAVDGDRLLAALAESAATVLQATPATWRLLLAAGWERERLRVWCGGEALPPELAAELTRRGSEVWNLYGPTETTIWSAAARVEPGEPVFLGRPVSDTWIHVVDRGLRLLPAGAVGELVIGGSGLARGYRNRPDGTAERFVPDPFAALLGRPGARLYRTGDLARRRPSGELEFLGRIDHQVKVRGYRIELGEIEAVLARHPGVREAVVVAREGHGGERRLAAFWTAAGGDASGAALCEHLTAHLPEYMVPSSFQRLEAMPLTPNGKVDRKALLRIEPADGAGSADHEPPQGELEETLAQIWRSVLPGAAHALGRQDHFFHLGGHSLLATQVVSRLRTLLGVEVPLRALFESPTLAAFASRVRRQMRREDGPGAVPPLSAEPELRGQPAPLSFAQQRLWFLDQLERGTAAYNIPTAFGLEGPLDAAALEAAFGEIVRRHDALRTTFHALGEEPVQTVSEPAVFSLPVVDLSGLASPGSKGVDFEPEGVAPSPAKRGRVGEGASERAFNTPSPTLPRADARERAPSTLPRNAKLAPVEAEGRRLLEAEARRPFDLQRGPLFRPVLVRLAAEEHLLSATIHHIVSDGWSGGVLVRELIALYRAAGEGRPAPLSALPIQYVDFARWQRRWLATGESLSAELAFWRGQLRDLPVRLDLPADRPRVPIRNPRGVRLPAGIGAQTARALRTLARAEGATLFMVLLAGFQALLSRLSGQLDLAIGSPVAGRTRVELEGLIGFFVNTLVIRGDLAGDPDVRTLIGRVRERTLAAQAHQELPFERLVEELQPERSLGHTPFFQVMFVFQNTPLEDLSLPGLRTAPVPVDTGTARFDLLLSLEEAPGGALTGWLEMNADLFDATTVRRLLGQLETLLTAAAEHPEERVASLPLLPAWERHQVVAEANGQPDVRVPWSTLHEAFESQAARTPNAPALIHGHERLSYRELDRRANALARHLLTLGAGPETVIGVCLPRTAALPVTLLAILKAGAAYLPLDPGYPADRIAFMLEDARVLAVVTLEGLLPGGAAGAREVLLDRLDRDAALLAEPEGEPLDSRGGPGGLAYLIYTSGSTGRPKGVAIEHGSAVRLVAWASTLHGPEELARVLAATSINFDLSVFELFVPLAFGGAVVLADDVLALPGLPAAGEVTLVNTVPSAIASLLEMGPLPASVRTVNLAGEPLRRSLVDRLYAPGAAPGLQRVWNLYGPSEDTTYSTFALTPRGSTAEPAIGRPVSGSRVYVLDRELRLQPLGVPGELALGGGGLARGYLGRPGLTAERFVPDPFGGEAGGRLYHTGDLTRLRPDGEIEFLGRIDHQVKIRGFRIELGEIESALARHPAVREAAVLVAGDDKDGERRLVAYFSLRPEARSATGEGAPELRRALAVELPGYMVPAAFVTLDELPHTPNGKIDRLALSRLPAQGETQPEAQPRLQAPPQGPTEELLAGIWSELLWVESIGRDDSFFDLGGHSLLGTRVVARVREALGIELPLTAVFEAPTLAGLARRIEEERPGPNSGPIPRVPRDRPLPLSFAQRRLWFLDRLQPGQAAYNMPLVVRLAGRLDVAALAGALGGLVLRHEGLRAVFVEEGEEPAQVFPHPPAVPLPVADLAALPSGCAAEEARRLSEDEARRPFDLARGPLLRASLLRLGEGDHHLLLTFHHIVADGWSLEVLFRDLAAFYAGSPLPELSIQPADHAFWEEAFLDGDRLAPQLAYWERQLAKVPVLELPSDHPRPAVRSLRGAVREGSLPPERVRELAAVARRERVTPFTLLLAAFQTLLFRYSGQEDLAVGSPVANRGRAELEPLIGLFVNTLVLRTRLAGDLPFRELLARVRQTVLEAFRHSDLPFERLVEHLNPERSLNHNPLFQTTFALQQVRSRGVELPGLTLEPSGAATGAVKFDLSLSVLDWGEPGGRWGMTLEYSSDLFDGATAERLLRHFEVLLAGAAAGVEEPLGRLPLLDEAERAQVLGPWSDGGPGLPETGEAVPVHEQAAAWAARTLEAPAVVWEGGRLTYGELNGRSNHLADELRERVRPGDVVGIYAGRSPEMVIAMLAVLKAGAAYAPLDPAWPRERVMFAVEDAAMPVLLAQGRLVDGLEVGAEIWELEERGSAFAGESGISQKPAPCHPERSEGSGGGKVESGRTVAPTQILRSAQDDGQGGVPLWDQLHALAYVIYTSGSTGTPKGVAVPHSGLANLVDWHRRAFAITPVDRATQIAGVAFDASVWEVWPYLASGASVHLVSEDVRLAPSRLVRWLLEKQITVAFLPTPLAELALDEPWPSQVALRTLLTGGDRLRCHPPAGLPFALVNCYGPTEGTVVATSGAVGAAGTGLPDIGRPIAGVRTLVLDCELQPVPQGVPGELFVGGAGLARGYLRRPDLTAASFVPDPFAESPGGRLYRTGDLVRFLAGGHIEFLRRLDDQVKVKGFRIELGEIEAALAEHPGVRDAVVVARADPRGEARLVAYGVASREPAAGELRTFLSRRLPEYMVPSLFLFLDALPLTPNGKVDRAALPAPDWQRPEVQGGYEPPRTPVEEILAAVWGELLEVEQVGIHDNFFELGGHSLKAGQLVLRVRDTFGVELPVRTVFEAPSVAMMAVAIGRKLVEQADPELLAQVLSEMQGA